MSLAGEWVLAIHGAIWFPVLYAMGLEGQSIEVLDRNYRYTAAIPPVPKSSSQRRRLPKRKAA
jgi:hypothetical protein